LLVLSVDIGFRWQWHKADDRQGLAHTCVQPGPMTVLLSCFCIRTLSHDWLRARNL